MPAALRVSELRPSAATARAASTVPPSASSRRTQAAPGARVATPAVSTRTRPWARSAASLRPASSNGLAMFAPKLKSPISEALNSTSGARIRPLRSSAMRTAVMGVRPCAPAKAGADPRAVGSGQSAVVCSLSPTADRRLPVADAEPQTPRFHRSWMLGPTRAVVRWSGGGRGSDPSRRPWFETPTSMRGLTPSSARQAPPRRPSAPAPGPSPDLWARLR